ncbi:MAG: hypothetical protein WC479_02940 [Candidatus Izemoplasmatales bacterium]
MNVSIRYSSHLPVLMEVMKRTTGDVLELGPGVFSTPVLHWLCEKHKRNLLTIESNRNWHHFCRKYYRTDYHKHLWVENWDQADSAIKKEWDVVLVDHSPSERRITEISKLANLAKYIVIHDADAMKDREYHYPEIYPLFKYRFNFTEVEPATTVLSNFVDLKDFEVCL